MDGGEVGFAKQLQCLPVTSLRVGNNPVNDFLTINVCGVLLRAGESILNRACHEADETDHHHKDDESGPIVLRGYAPG